MVDLLELNCLLPATDYLNFGFMYVQSIGLYDQKVNSGPRN
jgi:hypothetical protein